jgi:hypothetical protein
MSPATTAPPPPGTLGPTDEARWLANATFDVVAEHLPAKAAELQVMARAIGIDWYGPHLVVHDDTEALTTPDAAQLVRYSQGTVRRWACTPNPYDPDGGMLLPRHGHQGRYTTYLVRDLWAAKRDYQRMLADRRLAGRKWRATRITMHDEAGDGR